MHRLEKLAKLLRYYILQATTAAGSGHPTSSLSAADLMAALVFDGHFHFDLDHPDFVNNDRLIFSKGHAAPLFYALFAAAGKLTEADLLLLRQFGSPLEGHPTMAFGYTEVPTGSLGQGLSVGVGMALNARLDHLNYKTFVLLGDSEMSEGSVWEAIQIASYYNLSNLVGILDVNRLGQRGETMYGHNIKAYEERIRSFGWNTMTIDGHNLREIIKAFKWACGKPNGGKFPISNFQFLNKSQFSDSKPTMIIAKTIKGKGVSFLEDQNGWHGKALSFEELERALKELAPIDKTIIGEIAMPAKEEFPIFTSQFSNNFQISITDYQKDKPVATRKAYGNALVKLVETDPRIVVMDAETSNSTYAELVKKTHPERFFEMFIAEQNMAGAALGFSRRGKIPFVSTFAAFLSRAFDQIRMSQYAGGNIKFVGSHAGVSIGEDGASQMGLEEIAMFRALLGFVVLYPSDAVSCEKLVMAAAKHKGNVYLQTTRKDTPILYDATEEFPIGGSKVLRSSDKDIATVIGAGITVHEALAAHEELKKQGTNIRVIDLYSVKPIDFITLKKAAKETQAIITVEDHFAEGGIAEAVASTILGSSLPDMERGGGEVEKVKFASLAVKKMPKSGKPEELLAYEEIDKDAIIKTIRTLLNLD